MKRTILLFSLVFFAGCATVMTGNKQTISFSSTPSGAVVKNNGITLGKTPCSVALLTGEEADISFEKEGYKRISMDLKKPVNKWFLLNLPWLIAGGVGVVMIVVDLITGAYLRIHPTSVTVTLKKKEDSPPPTSSKPEKLPDPNLPPKSD